MKSKAFLIALSVCNDFDSFSTLLDTLEPKMIVLANPDTAGVQRGLEFLRGLPKATDFTRDKEMRATMLEKSTTPDGDVMRALVTQFENQFVINDNFEDNLQCRIM